MYEKLIILALPIAFLLDLLLGDPIWLPHPIVLFGKTIAKGEKTLNRNRYRRIKGLFLVLTLCTFTFISFYALINFTNEIHPALSIIITVIFAFYGLAHKTLIKEASMVADKLKNNGLEAGRNQLSRIVGRNTEELSENKIKTAVLETLSENLSDGVIAPLFYFAIGGIPAMMTYKLINTFDSMIGYKNERYQQFGWAAARLDDLVNLIPARITAILMALTTFSYRSFIFIFKYGHAHTSPNSGYPESALAGILDCRFGGPSVYGKKISNKPFIGKNDREISFADIDIAIRTNHKVSILAVLIIITIQWIAI